MKMDKLVYVAGPMSVGDKALNIRNGIFAANELLDAGIATFTPHLSHFQHMIAPRDYESWLALDFAVIRRCDALLRLPGYSEGADREVAFANEIGVPVFHSVEEIIDTFGKVTA